MIRLVIRALLALVTCLSSAVYDANAQTSYEQSTGVVSPAPIGAVVAPIWHVGDEWRYSYRSPAESGTFVWSVSRTEAVDGVPHYVIKSGTREIFYRVSDLAFSLERVGGVTVLRETPSRLGYVWPLYVGRAWEQKHVRENPVERQTIDRDSLYTVEAEETITVPAGTYRALKIVWRNKKTNAIVQEMWYASDVKLWIKMREFLSSGIRERELLGFKAKQTQSSTSLAQPDAIGKSTAGAARPAKPAIAIPVKISGSAPTFPRAAIRAGIASGYVVAQILIDEAGNVYGVNIVKSDPPGHFDQAVIEAVSQWKYVGDGIKHTSEVEIKFELKDEPTGGSHLGSIERQERDFAGLTARIAALVRKYEAAQPVGSVPDAERAALAREVTEARRAREILSYLPEAFSDSNEAPKAESKGSAKLLEAFNAVGVASFRPDRIAASTERRLAETLDSATLRVALQWERSELGRRISFLELEGAKPDNQTDKKTFTTQFRSKGGTADSARGRACAQKIALDNSGEAGLALFEALAASGLMAASVQKGQLLDMDGIARGIVALRPMFRDTARQILLVDCLFDLRDLSDAEFDQWLEFLRTDSGGRYARASNAAARDAFLEASEVFTRTLVDVARQMKDDGVS